MSEESFEGFKNSFSYGSRTDLSFKFLKGLSPEEAADFFQDLLTKVGETIDDGDPTRLYEHVVAAQIKGYAKPTTWTYEDGPFTPLSKKLAEMRLGLLTSTGHFMEGDDPEPFGVKEMSQAEAVERISDFLKVAPDLSPVPIDATPEHLHVRHGGYDIRGVQADRNVALPIDRMHELQAAGIFNSLAPNAYSFVGAAAQRRLQKESIPGWIEQFQADQMEGIVMVPV